MLLHAANGAVVVVLTFLLTKRRGLAWLTGTIFTAAAVITEAVSGVVGIADVLGGLGALLALLSLLLPMWAMPFAVMGSVMFGLFSKESALVCVPLIPFAALLLSPVTHPDKPRRVPRALLALVGSVAAFVLYVEIRKRVFPAPMESTLNDPLPDGATLAQRAHRAFMVWFHQPPLPKDPLNNPFVKADGPHRIAGALRVYWRGLGQVILPRTLSGDYSFPQEPVPETLYFPESILGGLALILPPFASLGIWIRSLVRERRARRAFGGESGFTLGTGEIMALLVALGITWVAVSYFPHSNIPVLLPTVRAERFWYFPVIGSSLALGVFFVWLFERTQRFHDGALAVGLFAFFILFQAGSAFRHSRDYKDDLTFWTATRQAVPNSAKAHLNYSVMWGARGRLDIRAEANRTAIELAPEWPMAHVYLGDTLCRMHKADEAWEHYARGFPMAENDPNLIALGLQCLWEEKVTSEDGTPISAFRKYEPELLQMADKHPGSWLAYHARDVSVNGDKNEGVDKKYRPRGYNQGAKDE